MKKWIVLILLWVVPALSSDLDTMEVKHPEPGPVELEVDELPDIPGWHPDCIDSYRNFMKEKGAFNFHCYEDGTATWVTYIPRQDEIEFEQRVTELEEQVLELRRDKECAGRLEYGSNTLIYVEPTYIYDEELGCDVVK